MIGFPQPRDLTEATLTIIIGTSQAPSSRETHAAWLRRRLTPEISSAGGTAVLERHGSDLVVPRPELPPRSWTVAGSVQDRECLGEHVGGVLHVDLAHP
jgi:hypothetical protein